MSYNLIHKTDKKISSGKYYPLGATLTQDGVNFAIYSQYASEVYLILFEKSKSGPTDIIRLEGPTKYIWYIFIHGIKAGQLYGYKIKGEYNPAIGLRFNENKLLIDPYAKAINSKVINTDNLLLAYNCKSQNKDFSFDERDNSVIMPKSIVIDDKFEWEGDIHQDIEVEKLFIYEVHVKGFTASKTSGVKKAGTYLGFIEKIPYLKSLGINAVELLPIHEFYVEDFLISKGLTNYWGYNSICFFAPEQSYGSMEYPGCQVNEFKTLVKELHKAGIEVILDVVYNHTGEGNEMGPMINFKGIDNLTYYCLTGKSNEEKRYYLNYSGCGNSLNLDNAYIIRFVLDSLRYWVEVMHVDGFRFDLASVLGRENGKFKSTSPFFDAISQDPVLNHIKLIAEPWDLNVYEVGNFPLDWCEWNGKFRDTIRKFVKGDSDEIKDLGFRLTGSADLYLDDGRSAYNSINFITCHDGFTLYDLVSYNSKHNEANLENNNDGSNENNSWNCGIEGTTIDKDIIKLRKQQIKNYFCYLLFSSGTPMILGGDEFLRTQLGNNNAYCQDNEISWFDWNYVKMNEDIIYFVKKSISFIKRYPILQKKKFYCGCDKNGNSIPDLAWFDFNGNYPSWDNINMKTLCYQLDGSEVEGDNNNYLLFFILNSDYKQYKAILPKYNKNKWYRVIDTSLSSKEDFLEEDKGILLKPQDFYLSNPRSVVVLLGKY